MPTLAKCGSDREKESRSFSACVSEGSCTKDVLIYVYVCTYICMTGSELSCSPLQMR